MSAAAAIETDRLNKIFLPPLARLRRRLGRPLRRVVAVRDVTLTVAPGEIFGLVGRNGMGKTTLLKMICALLRPTAGGARVFGRDVERDPHAAKQGIGLVSSEERSFYYRLTGRQNLMFFARLFNLSGAAARRRIAELTEWMDARAVLDRRYQELSSGWRQRLALMRALLGDPPLLLLDEPTRSLDPLAAEELRRLIRDRLCRAEGKTIFITSHNLAEVEDLCDRVGILYRGELKMCASMDELRRRYADRERIILRLRGAAPTTDGLANLSEAIEGLEWSALENDRWEARFTRQMNDGLLNLAIDRIRAAGAEIEACDTIRSGLKDLMTSLEQ